MPPRRRSVSRKISRFWFKLERVLGVLVMTPAAVCKVLAPRNHPFRRSLKHFLCASTKEAGLHPFRSGQNALARQHIGDEEYLSVHARQSFASVDKLFDLDIDSRRRFGVVRDWCRHPLR